ncbi:MAG: hypothetical protein IJ217_04465 [Clostridia bacterium]|nr:hypothetical protein [Clostridia bacterium]
MQIKILHLYYDIMNLYGEYGNVKILETAIKEQGFQVIVEKKSLGDELSINDYDFIYLGCGTERNQSVVLEDLKRYQPDLKKYIEESKVMLATGNSYEMFGKSIEGKEALGIFDFEVSRTKDRVTSDVIYKSKYLEKEVVGFVNKMSNIVHNLNPLFEVEFGIGENEKNNQEGVKYKSFYGTYVSGPILVRNPEFLRHLVKEICCTKDTAFQMKEIYHENEEKGYELVLKELKGRGSV